MATATRTDIHRPGAIIPADYEYVGPECVSAFDWEAAAIYRQVIREHMQRTGGKYSRHAHGGNCMVCGNANAIYTILFYHAASNTYVRMGQDCADNVESSYDNREFRRFVAAIGKEREYRTGKERAEKLLAERGLTRAWELFSAEYSQDFQYEELTIRDIVSKLVRYGDLSDPQWGFLPKLFEKLDNREQLEAVRQAEREAAADIPDVSERTTIIGKILSTKVVDTGYGPQMKMLVQHESGWKCWGSKPADLDADVGDVVQFDARLTASNDDPKFGFYSRPTKAVAIELAD